MHQQPPPRWPGGARCAVMLSFELDGPTLCDPARHDERGVVHLGQQTYDHVADQPLVRHDRLFPERAACLRVVREGGAIEARLGADQDGRHPESGADPGLGDGAQIREPQLIQVESEDFDVHSSPAPAGTAAPVPATSSTPAGAPAIPAIIEATARTARLLQHAGSATAQLHSELPDPYERLVEGSLRLLRVLPLSEGRCPTAGRRARAAPSQARPGPGGQRSGRRRHRHGASGPSLGAGNLCAAGAGWGLYREWLVVTLWPVFLCRSGHRELRGAGREAEPLGPAEG